VPAPPRRLLLVAGLCAVTALVGCSDSDPEDDDRGLTAEIDIADGTPGPAPDPSKMTDEERTALVSEINEMCQDVNATIGGILATTPEFSQIPGEATSTLDDVAPEVATLTGQLATDVEVVLPGNTEGPPLTMVLTLRNAAQAFADEPATLLNGANWLTDDEAWDYGLTDCVQPSVSE
jgi:hypothetical protein